MKVIWMVVLLLTAQVVPGQEPQFSWGLALPKAAPQQEVTILGTGSPVYYVVTKNAPAANQFSWSYYLEAFKENHDRIFVKEVTPSPQYDVAGVAFVKGKVVLFSYGFEKTQSADVLMATTYDVVNPAGQSQQLSRWIVDRMANRGRFSVSQSPGLGRLVVAYEPTWKRGENEQVQLAEYNDALDLQWQATQTLPYEWKRGVNNDYYINDKGIAFIVKRVVLKGEDNHYALLSYDGKKLFHHPLDPGDEKKIVAIRSMVAADGSLVTGGYYSEDNRIRLGNLNYHGNFLFGLGPDGSTVTTKYLQPFAEKRKDLKLHYLYLHDEKYFILGQREAVSSSLSSDREKAAKGEYDRTFYSGNIYVDAFDIAGKHLYSREVGRNLDSKNDFGVSNGFFAAPVGDKLYILFNDETSRYDGKKIIITFYDPLLPVLVKLKATSGEMSAPMPIYNSGGVGGKRAEMRMRPDVFTRISETHYLLRGENNQLFKMGSIRLQP